MYQFIFNDNYRPLQSLPFCCCCEDSSNTPMAHCWTLVPAARKMDKQHEENVRYKFVTPPFQIDMTTTQSISKAYPLAILVKEVETAAL
jgi:hypothetical protein